LKQTFWGGANAFPKFPKKLEYLENGECYRNFPRDQKGLECHFALE